MLGGQIAGRLLDQPEARVRLIVGRSDYPGLVGRVLAPGGPPGPPFEVSPGAGTGRPRRRPRRVVGMKTSQAALERALLGPSDHGSYRAEATRGAADARLTELARANEALQTVTDALAQARGFDEIVPTVLAVAARTFGIASAAYFEHGGPDGETVFLRYWLYEGRVLRPAELLAADPTMPRPWLDGFRPGANQGGPLPSADTRVVVIDHTVGHTADTPQREVAAWCRAHGWPLALRVPCMVGGVARGGLVLCRAESAPYTAAEIALAEALAKQLALAVQADRLAHAVSDGAVERAVGLERERATDRRAEELAHAHDALQSVTDALASARGFDALVPAVLGIAARTFGAGALGYFERTGPAGETVVVRYWLIGDRLFRPAELAAVDPLFPGLWLDPFAVPDTLGQLGRTAAARAQLGAVVADIDDYPTPPGYAAWFNGRGWPLVLNVPCAVDGVALGSLVVCRGRETPYTSAEVALGRGIGSQLALALEADRLARAVQDGAVERAVERAVARERERAADERAAELARANATLRETANQLAGAPDLGQFLEQTLLAIARELAAETAVVITYDAEADAFAHSAYVEGGRAVRPETRACVPTVLPRCDVPCLERVLEASDGYAMFDVVRDRDQHWPGVADYLTARGLTTSVVFPIRLAGRQLGQIRTAFGSRPTITPAQAELVEALANQAALAIELRRLAHQARTAAVTAAVAGERNALAREVHDTLAQGFSGIVMQLGAARDQLGPAAADSPALARVERLAREHLAEARHSIAALRPDGPGAAGAEVDRPPVSRALEAELRRAVATARDVHVTAPGAAAAEVAVAVQGTPRRLPADVELELLRVAQAALANALRHAHARQIRVELAFTPDAPGGGVRLAITDDGRGFDPDAVRPGRFGLMGMVERAARVGAALTIVTAPDEGTEIVAMWQPAGR
jgi:signal transduction histidine kinase